MEDIGHHDHLTGARVAEDPLRIIDICMLIDQRVRCKAEDQFDAARQRGSAFDAVVFGGHLSWLKAIRPLLPNVRFVEPSAQPNAGLIMNADVIWIQTNAMSHSDFYKIIDVVRKHNIELHYFTYASAEKCAEQFALNDMGETKNASE